LTQVVRVAGGPSLWQDNGLRYLKANLVRGMVKLIGNGSTKHRGHHKCKRQVNPTNYMYLDN